MSAKRHIRLILLVILLLTSGLAVLDAQAQTSPVCPLGQGYWANHPESWATTSLMLGTQFYSQAELLALVPGGGGDASTILAVQLIAAKLNIAAGADPTPISGALLTADSLLGQFTGKLPYNVAPSSPQGQAMVNIAGLLDSYNNGQLTPNCAATPTATFTPTTTPPNTTVVVIIQGPVQAINVNIITIAGINIQVNPGDPILASIQVGTPIRVEGTIGTDAAGVSIIISPIVTLAPADVMTVTLYIRGVVDGISSNIITISGISVQIDPANPTLPAVQIGDIVEINANVNFDGVTIIVIATTVTIVINTVPEATPTSTPTTTPPTATPTGTLTVTPTPTSGLPITIIIEGPVETINVNIITIYDIDIEIDINDPILTVIQVGDIVHVEGDTIIDADTLIIIAITVVIVDVDVIINVDGDVWRDSGDCGNGPPPWAPAHGWRRRCEGGGGDSDDDDDDD